MFGAVSVLNHPFVGCVVPLFEDLVRDVFQHTKDLFEFGMNLVVIIIFEGKIVTGIISCKHLAATGKLGRSEGGGDRRSNGGREKEEGGRSHSDEIYEMHVEGGLMYFFGSGLQVLWIGCFEECPWKIVSVVSACSEKATGESHVLYIPFPAYRILNLSGIRQVNLVTIWKAMPDDHRHSAKLHDANFLLKREDVCSNPLASWMWTSYSLSERDRRGRCILGRLRLG